MISFTIQGHGNIKASHKNTIEFTKEKELTESGDCILGVNADYNLDEIKEFIKRKDKIICKIEIDDISDEFEFIPNPKFNSNEEMVFRIGEFDSERTIGIRATKAAKHVKREIVEKLKKGIKAKIILDVLE